MNKSDPKTIERMVSAALEEDGAHSDITVEFVGVGDNPVEADVFAGNDGVVCGIQTAREVFRQMDASISYEARVVDGNPCAADDVVCSVSGPARSIIAAERVALNFLQRLSGISTLAAAYVTKVAGSGVTILDTRKTTPLWRDLEKYAVRCGGAHNHRRDLRSMVLVKENHIRAVGGEDAVIERLKAARRQGGPYVEVEVDSIPFLRKLLEAPIDRVMLDNFAPAEVSEALKTIVRASRLHGGERPEVEVSGGITLENVSDYAIDGVDYVSVGALTHSAPALSMSMEVR